MGNPISKIRAEAEQADEAKKMQMEERLQILEKMVTSRLQTAQASIVKGQRGDQEVHSGVIVEEFKQISIVQTSKASPVLKEAIDNFFSGNFLKGLNELVNLAVEAVLGNASMGEYESSEMFIVWHNNALLLCIPIAGTLQQ